MSDIAWIKLKTDMFDHEKIKVIESMPEADTILVVWVKILVLAAKANASGFLMIAENVPYTEDMLAAVVGRPLNTVRMALQTFRRLAMIDPAADMIRIKNWEVHQNVDGMDRIRQQNRLRVEKYREKQKLIGCNVTGNVTETPSNAADIDKEEDKEKRNIYSAEFESAWNDYPKRAGSNSKKEAYRAWNARLKEGHTTEAMHEGTKRYAAYCKATDRLGTEYVMQAATFFGPDDPPKFSNDWTPPPKRPSAPAMARRPQTDDEIQALGRTFGIEPKRGESMGAYKARVCAEFDRRQSA